MHGNLWVTLAEILGVLFILLGGIPKDHRGYDPPPPEMKWMPPLWVVLLCFVGMGVLAPLVTWFRYR